MKTIKIAFIGWIALIGGYSFAQVESPSPNAPSPKRPKAQKVEYVTIEGQEFEVSRFPDEEAEFPGGQKALDNYIKENLTYPKDALDGTIEGKVFVVFLIDVEGKARNARVEFSTNAIFREEALRLVNNMPNWTPAKKNGEIIVSECRLPVIFKLTE